MSIHKWLSTGSIYLNVEASEDKDIDVIRGTKVKKSNKYGPPLKHFLPYRRPPIDSKAMPSNSAGLFSYIAVAWMTKIMWRAYLYGLTEDDLYDLQGPEDLDVGGRAVLSVTLLAIPSRTAHRGQHIDEESV